MIDHVVSKPSFIHTKSGNEAGLDDTDNLLLLQSVIEALQNFASYNDSSSFI